MNKYWEDAFKTKMSILKAERHVAEENARYKMEKEKQMLDKLNDSEYVKQQYNMPLNDRQFVDWLRGAVDLVGDEPPTKEQWANIKTGIARVIAKRMLNTKEVEYAPAKGYQIIPSTSPQIWSSNPMICSSGTNSAFNQGMANATVANWSHMRNEYILKDE